MKFGANHKKRPKYKEILILCELVIMNRTTYDPCSTGCIVCGPGVCGANMQMAIFSKKYGFAFAGPYFAHNANCQKKTPSKIYHLQTCPLI